MIAPPAHPAVYGQVTIQLDGPLDVRRLHAACRARARRHGFPRTIGGDPWSACDLSRIHRTQRDRCMTRLADAARRETPAAPASLRTWLLHFAQTEHALMLICSADAADTATLALCSQEILRCYDDPSHSDAPVSLPYARVIGWQREMRQDESEDAHAGRRYWATQRVGAFEPAALPFQVDTATGNQPHPRGSHASRRFELTECFAYAIAHRPAFWIVCLQTVLYRASHGTRFVTGVIPEARRFDELKDVIGPLDRILPVPYAIDPTRSVAQNVARLETLVEAHTVWQEYYDEPGNTPWHVGCVYRVWPHLLNRGPLRARLVEPVLTGTGAPLDVFVNEHASGMGWHLRLQYERRRFDARDVDRLGRWLLTYAHAAAARPDSTLDALSLLPLDEREQIVSVWNATARGWRGAGLESSLPAWLDAQARLTPDAVAVCDGHEAIPYATLHARANQLARRLRRLGVRAEARVGVWAPRSVTLVTALLGVLKAGAAYVPLDPAYPAARLAFQVRDARVGVIVTAMTCAASIPAGPYTIEVIDGAGSEWREESTDSVDAPVFPDQLAYVIYTSGSTGQPKGAMNTQRGVVNQLAWMQDTYRLGPDDRVLQKTSISFDDSVCELFWPLITGATMVLAPSGAQQDPVSLAELIARTHVTVLHFVPAMLDAFVAAGGLAACDGVRLMISSGEALPAGLAGRVQAAWAGRLENLYGPAEAAVDVTAYPCGAAPSDAATVPIGRPIANTQVYVREISGQAAPVGVIGELYLGGVQLGRGYLERPDLTAERFVPDPFGPTPGARLYRTGDLARYRGDGVIEYAGRADQQVKLHGNRIELGEIEAALRRVPGVRDAAALLREDEPGVRRVVAYVIGASPTGAITIESLREHLRAQLPEYMVPAVFVPLPAFPLSPNGKVDRRSFPAPSTERPALTSAYVPPRTPTEAVLTDIWTRVLRRDRVGVHDNFFALGGDSIMSLQVVARAAQAGWRLSPRLIFEHPTIAQLASVATAALDARADQEPLVGPVPLTPIQHWFLSHRRRKPQHYNQAMRVAVPMAMASRIDAAWVAMQRHHDALRFRDAPVPDNASILIQRGTDIDTVAPATVVDLCGVAPEARVQVDRRVVTAAQVSLELAAGPVARAVMLLADVEARHVLFLLHHLIVDGVSWRVLLADFQQAIEQLHAGEVVSLPPKTHSQRAWVAALTSDAARDLFLAQLPFWRAATAAAARLPCDRVNADNSIRQSRTQQSVLTGDDTRILLHDASAHGAHVGDVLLAALVHALGAWTGAQTWRIDLEGHGRDVEIAGMPADVDVSRTVGWFTSLYPVRLTADADPAATLRSTMMALRQVPLNGIGYGVLRYLDLGDGSPLHDAAPAELLFNYLGQADDVFDPSAAFRAGVGPTGAVRDPDGPREYLLEFNAIIFNGLLRVSWTYSPHFDPSSIARLVDHFDECLQALLASITHGSIEEAIESVAFQGAALDDDELGRMARLLDEGTTA
jgi:amino acid adenylation domain-containing protein/non-ribosomal peptide synthase protein (TIGR01720 family)